jgi:c-di-GMP-binding flagellar brake protein YcgR
MYKGEERRKFRRVKAQVQVEMQKYESEPMLLSSSEAASKDVSAAGILMKHDEQLPVSQTVLARFSLPGEKTELEITGRVVRCREVEGGYEIALEFLDPSANEIEQIERYVQASDNDTPIS